MYGPARAPRGVSTPLQPHRADAAHDSLFVTSFSGWSRCNLSRILSLFFVLAAGQGWTGMALVYADVSVAVFLTSATTVVGYPANDTSELGRACIEDSGPYIDVLPIRLRDPHTMRHYQSKHNLTAVDQPLLRLKARPKVLVPHRHCGVSSNMLKTFNVVPKVDNMFG